MDKNGGKKNKIKCTKRKTKIQYVSTYHNNSYQRRLLLRLSNTRPIGPVQTHEIFIQMLYIKSVFDTCKRILHTCMQLVTICM